MARIARESTSRSQKTAIIEALFGERWDPITKELSGPVVRVEDIRRHKAGGNVYAFFKDIVRNTARANAIWAACVLEQGYTGVQDVSERGNSFRFVPLQPGQSVAFVSARVLHPDASAQTHRIESASLPLASRQLGRGDESAR